jgi:plexin A
MLIQLDTLESNVRNECKQAFAELQTEVSDLTSDLSMTGIPFWDYRTYTFKVLFPSHTDHPILHNPVDVSATEFHESKMGGFDQGLQQFNQLLNSKQFLVIFIRTLEQQKNFSMRDKSVVASLLMVILQDKMEYATEILKALLNDLIDKSVERKTPKLLFRRTESVVEKFLANWLSLCMYGYLKKQAGKPLYLLYKAIKHQTTKGPVDAITAEARYSLSEDRLLREKVEPKILTLHLILDGGTEPVSCKALDCDTITQAKDKALDAIYMNMPWTRRPSVYDVDLEWRSGRSGHLMLQDEDVTTDMVKGWKRVNTLAHYHIPDGAQMALVQKRNKNDFIRQMHGMVEITSGSSFSTLTPIITVEEGTKVWHLVKHDDSANISRTQKVISEIFLTRLLTTKGTLQQYIDDLFLTILRVDTTIPPAIKYLFDFLDNAARRHNIIDAEVVHTWKSNSLPLRFWVNIMKNPEFCFDINKTHIVDSCLSVIAQTFMDSCSTSEHRLGKDSPTNKLLFAKDIPKYRKWVERYYSEVRELPQVSDQDMNVAMTELSMHYIVDFNTSCALKELYRYATQYNFELLEALDDDPSAKKLHLANKFEQVAAVIDGGPMY